MKLRRRNWFGFISQQCDIETGEPLVQNMLTLTAEQLPHDQRYQRILGINFFSGGVEDVIAAMRSGGLLVAPAAPALLDLQTNGAYREALQRSDVCLTDSSFMVIIWNWFLGGRISRISGLTFMRRLLEEPCVRESGATFWIMSSETSASENLKWLEVSGIRVPEDHFCVSPWYRGIIEDAALVKKLNMLRPKHIIVTLGGGTQEPLGLYLKQALNYQPAIYCTGAALGFMSGDQVKIPAWVDRCRLGWAMRCVSNPSVYLKRYWRALQLLPMMLAYGSELPPDV